VDGGEEEEEEGEERVWGGEHGGLDGIGVFGMDV